MALNVNPDLERYESERLEDEESIKQVVQEKQFAQHKDVKNWLEAWGTEKEKECRPIIK